MEHGPIHVVRGTEQLMPEEHRVITRYFELTSRARIRSMVRRALRIPEERIGGLLDEVLSDFGPRHRGLDGVFLDHYAAVSTYCPDPDALSQARRLLIGAYFTMEYSFEGAALFNPSIVAHPDQSGLGGDSTRFLLSLRAVGEGHISSIVFRRGVIDGAGGITFDPPPRYAYCARPRPMGVIEKREFLRRLLGIGTPEELAISLLVRLPDRFGPRELGDLADSVRQAPQTSAALHSVVNDMEWLARANYELRYPSDCRPAEIVVFPSTESERRGMEDLRLVRLLEDSGRTRYLGTYTAYDGRRTLPMMLETQDFSVFRVTTLVGKFARNKNLALFPRQIAGRYFMLARCDGVNLFLLSSDSLHEWNHGHKLIGPQEPWELTQLGNCGSPVETERGWLVLTHGVGPVRRYCIGAVLLDREDPSRMVGRLREPLMRPEPGEREGYVPNVLYSCGSMVHRDRLIIPYAVSDTRTAFATVSLPELLDALVASGA